MSRNNMRVMLGFCADLNARCPDWELGTLQEQELAEV